MKRPGFLLRFIDIGLIILFGFLVISDIDVFSHIDMPSDDEDEVTEEQLEMAFISVEIFFGEEFTASDIETEQVLCERVSLAGLEECLVDMRAQYEEQGMQPVVLIEPEDDSIVQSTIDVLDVCDRHGIARNINVSELEL